MRRQKSIVLLCAFILTVGCATTDGGNRQESPVQQTTHPAIEAFLREMVEIEHFSGVVLVLQDGRVLHASGYGSATRETPNRVDTRYHVASVTKQFTAAAVMQLVERGAIDLKDPINDHLPSQYRTRNWDDVTIHHLLSHSSGIPDYAISRGYYEVKDGCVSHKTIDDMISEGMSRELEFPPGSQYAYSNLGYALLGEIIEYRANESFADFVERNIFEPMGMHSSRIRTEGHVPGQNEAMGFRWSDDEAAFLEDNSKSLPATPPDAGLITTLGDFARWAQAFIGGDQDILDNDPIEAMTTQHSQMGRGGAVDAYGYGLGVGDRLIAHSGRVVGFRSQVIFDPQTRTVIAVFSNNSAVNMQPIAFGLLPIVFGPGS